MPEPFSRKILTTQRPSWLPFALLVAILFVLYAVLPSAGSSVFNSPDETAAATVAREISSHWRAFAPESLALAYPWLHPRSFVSVGDRLAPVGFLGWPFVLGLFYKVFGDFILRWGGAFLLLSAVWPFFQLLRARFGDRASWFGSLVAFTVPAMILYANRGLFSNGAVLAFGLWTFWLLLHVKESGLTPVRAFIVGLLAALTIATRPVELIWILLWWTWAAWTLRPKKREWFAFILGLLLVFIPVLWLARDAYGTVFGIGYRLHDNPPAVSAPSIAVPKTEQGRSWLWLPYGFHPRNILVNMEAFVLRLSWPWTLLLFIVSIATLRSRPSKELLPLALAAWTIASLIFLYGSGLYADHVGAGVVAIGNSFLRYVMPAALFCGWAFAFAWEQLAKTETHRRLFVALAIFLVAFGVWRVTWADDEGLASVRPELARYEQVRAATHAWFSSSDVILSDRSDKIFFPEFRAVSPVPAPEQVRALVQEKGVNVGFYGRPLSQTEKDHWRSYGIDAQELGSFARERMYRFVLLKP